MAEITGSGSDDTIRGTQGADVIDAGLGADIVFGLTGDDAISGRSGNDLLFGGSGDDILFGTVEFLLGNDLVIEGGDDDVLVGGDGADAFMFDLRRAAAGNDVVADFAPGTDMIILAGFPENLDTNNNRQLDAGDSRVDVVEGDLQIALTGATTAAGGVIQGNVTILGVSEVAINEDVFLA
jgi:Ca2+-binding RTX toxin-like protein